MKRKKGYGLTPSEMNLLQMGLHVGTALRSLTELRELLRAEPHQLSAELASELDDLLAQAEALSARFRRELGG